MNILHKKKIKYEFIISYLGIFPIFFCLIDLKFFSYFSTILLLDFVIYYSLLIFTFIGAINWQFKISLPNWLVICGFIPSFISMIIIIFTLMDFNKIIILLIIIFIFFLQIIFDYSLLTKNLIDKNFYNLISLPITIIIFSLILFMIN